MSKVDERERDTVWADFDDKELAYIIDEYGDETGRIHITPEEAASDPAIAYYRLRRALNRCVGIISDSINTALRIEHALDEFRPQYSAWRRAWNHVKWIYYTPSDELPPWALSGIVWLMAVGGIVALTAMVTGSA